MNTSSLVGWVPGDLITASTAEYEWLRTYILTKAIQRTYQAPVTIRVLGQSFTYLEEGDRSDQAHAHGYLREVLLCVREEPVVYARTSIVNPSPVVKESIITLGARPIGVSLLYNNSQVKRSPFSYQRFNNLEAAYSSAPREFQDSPVWARRSTFHWDETDILITEFFSPNIKPLVAEDQPAPLLTRLVG